jgi:hypothetical protein
MHRREAVSLLEIDIEIGTPIKGADGGSKKGDDFALFGKAS